MLDLVANGVGVGVAPSCVTAQARAQELKTIPVRNLEISWSLTTSLAKRGSRIVQELTAMFLSFVGDAIAESRWPTAYMGLKKENAAPVARPLPGNR